MYITPEKNMATKDTETLTPSEKRAAKRREAAANAEAVFGTGRGSSEPVINPMDYTISLMRALNYYNSAFDNKDKRKWFMSYVGKKSTEFDSLSDWEFRSVGTMIRLKQRDQHLEDREIQFIENSIAELRIMAKEGKTVSALKGEDKVIAKPVVTIQDRIAETASMHIGEINGLFDEFITNDVEVNITAYLKGNQVAPQVSKLIPAAFQKTINELNEAVEGTDKQLVEAYSFMKKTKLKKLIKAYESIADACAQQIVSAKSARKPTVRKIKVKPPAVIAKNVKFMREHVELKLKSVAAENIVESKEVWLYNTKTKKLQVYRPVGDGVLTVKGTAIIGYEVATSGAKSMRKPELVASFADMTKRSLATEFKALTTKESAVTGRINADTIILRAFK
jgi:hypothetical protein